VVEKAMKGELIRLGWRLERTHDLERLLDLLITHRSDLVTVCEPLCEALADAYFSDRYPGFDLDDPDWPLFNRRLEAAGKLVETVTSRASPKPPPATGAPQT
jgi:HEPN domain-containing protein